jgi:hypothetical protein
MGASRSPGTQPTDGARAGAWRPSIGLLAIAIGIVVSGLTLVLASAPASRVVAADDPPPPVPSAASSRAPVAVPLNVTMEPLSANPPVPAQPVDVAAAVAPPSTTAAMPVRTREPDSDPTPDLSDFVNPGETPTMSEVIQRLHQAGVTSGLGAFAPPGTRPPRVGIAVPEDFVLPEGYVRHYQATDDGQRIEPILMFSPDYRFVGADGRPVEIPKDRVVPPELAPPGLPIRTIVIPRPSDAGRPGR